MAGEKFTFRTMEVKTRVMGREITISFIELFRAAVRKAGSDQELAKVLHIKPTTVLGWRNNKFPRQSTLWKIVDYLEEELAARISI